MKKSCLLVLAVMFLSVVPVAHAYDGYWTINSSGRPVHSGEMTAVLGQQLAYDRGFARGCAVSYGAQKGNEVYLFVLSWSGHISYSYSVPLKLNESVSIGHTLDTPGTGTVLRVKLIYLNPEPGSARFQLSVESP